VGGSDEIETDVATGGEQSPGAKLVLDAAEVAIVELEADRDRWRERAEKAEKRLKELGD
jgi:hypothetical protein